VNGITENKKIKKMKNFKQLIVWQKGIKLVKQAYLLTKQLPSDERFGLISQINRAAVSIPANIAEGSSRNSEKDYLRFLQIALGSDFELQTYCVLIRELGWEVSNLTEFETGLDEVAKMLQGLIKSIEGANR
jgi:four helix bundle protein